MLIQINVGKYVTTNSEALIEDWQSLLWSPAPIYALLASTCHHSCGECSSFLPLLCFRVLLSMQTEEQQWGRPGNEANLGLHISQLPAAQVLLETYMYSYTGSRYTATLKLSIYYSYYTL